MTMASQNETPPAGLLAMDCDAVGRLVRSATLKAMALHFAETGSQHSRQSGAGDQTTPIGDQVQREARA